MKKDFMKIKREIQSKKKAVQRVENFDPIYTEFDLEKAKFQSKRCLKCPVDVLDKWDKFDFCRTGCPLGNKIPLWIDAVKKGDIEKAFEYSNEISPFPEILGRICPHDSLCQGSCTIEKTEYGSVTVGAIEVFLNEEAFKMGFVPDYGKSIRKTGKKVAIIGSGPAGMSCATFLLKGGVEVEMFEKSDRPGGLLTYGIPNFKIDKSVVFRRFEWMKDAGLKLHLNSEVSTKQMKKLLNEFDAVFIGVGAPKGRSARMENEDANGVYHVMNVLTHIQKIIFGDIDKCMIEGKDVVVIGGGDSAMDALRNSVRRKAKSVKCLYRRNEENMPGSKKEVINAKEEGVEFVFYTAPKSVIVDKNRNVKGIICQKTRLGEPDSNGRKRIEIEPDSDFEVKCDIIILSLGFDNVEFPWYEEANIKVGKWGDIIVDQNKRTSNPKIYAGGDAVRGADLAVTAAADGRIAAFSIMEDLFKK